MTIPGTDLTSLLQRYEEGAATPEEVQLLEQWYHQLDIADSRIFSTLSHEQEINERLHSMILRGKGHARRRRIMPHVIRIAAASLVAVALLWLARFSQRHSSAAIAGNGHSASSSKAPAVLSPVHLMVASSDKKDLVKISLPDGSTAWLNRGSVLKYPDHFNDAGRSVEVQAGEVFFNVVPDRLHPFQVHTGSVTTTVLGTSFLVKQSFEKNTVEISVRTGAVKVEKMNRYGAGALVGRQLLPGDQLRFDTTANVYQLKKVAVRGIDAFLFRKLIYEDTRLEEIIYDLSRKYGISIRFGNNGLKDCRYRIGFDDMPLADVLQILAALTNTHIEKKKAGIYIINGETCH